MSALDPIVHHPGRLRIIASLAALPAGDALCLTRLQKLAGLSAVDLRGGLHRLAGAGYVRADQAGVALTGEGRAALDRYTARLRQLTRAAGKARQAPPACLRAGDADRDAVTSALSEHFAQGRLTLAELSARTEAALTATTHGELSLATWDLPTLPEPEALTASPARRRRTRRGD